MKISVVSFKAQEGEGLIEQADHCLLQLNAYLSDASLDLGHVISINFFISAGSNGDYLKQVSAIKNHLPNSISDKIPVACLAQAPADGSLVSAEVYLVANPGEADILPKRVGDQLYLAIEKGDQKMVIANGIGAKDPSANTAEAAEEVFLVMERILDAEGLDFGNIFRQWNYIENITVLDSLQESGNQHYQLFNNVRSKYYARSDFRNGYPAATGIGISAGGVIVSFFAATEKGHASFSIENPLQKSAFEYTKEVLVGESEYQGYSKCTPKFARAKLLVNSESEQVFISGTASIRDQFTVGKNDVVKQTEITLDNINSLISEESMSNLERKKNTLPEIAFIRVYIKYREDYEAVKQLCDKRLPGVSSIFVVSDVCRDDLLVEIEAIAYA